ncbi:hypothetical protein MMF93_23850 [Streptomyces tubbatahanensis]|uniref:Uncharacterized protein n=1 Tax=Streptomyces tubbatahanensis TaxID=2923272 RepID=A0ABY3XY38_9ACTN|nr:hypothetical protein [Streptomyces tubbatahanensis]UNS99158.1 hypothetical protein MMF93_23850 [Streptomyces tubbatahanensis]
MSVQHDAGQQTGARHLLSDSQFEAVTATVLADNPGMSGDVATKVAAEALAFVAACARPGSPTLRPSKHVDEGWHALIVHTRVYAGLCERLGRFVHHVPELPGTVARVEDGTLERTRPRSRRPATRRTRCCG